MNLSPKFLLGMVIAIAVSIAFGLLAGNLSVPKSKILQQAEKRSEDEKEQALIVRNHNTRFMASVAPGSHLPSIMLEMQYAYELGITEFIVQSPMPWTEQQQTHLADAIKGIKEIGDDTTIALALDCNPPQSWLSENPDETSTVKVDGIAYPSVGSVKWKIDTQSQITKLLKSLNADIKPGRITGIILQGLEHGQWTRSGTYDTSPAHEAAFRNWALSQYKTIEAVAGAWADQTPEALKTNTLPDFTTTEPSFEVFFASEKDQQKIDYNRFVSDSTSAFITDLASSIRKQTNKKFSILATYPNLIEHTSPASGNGGTGSLHNPALNGIMTQAHAKHRQVGQHGYYASPVFQGQQTLSVDTTYTGIAYDQNARSINVPGTYLPRQVVNLMARNAITSALAGTTWIISDASGAGAFAHKPLWSDIDALLTIRDTMQSTQKATAPKLAVVIDENSPAFIKNTSLYSSIFDSLLDTLTHSGINFTWITLDTLLESDTPAAPVYLFPNLFNTSPEKRDQLHTTLTNQQATAIWLYAAGYIDETADVTNLSTLTKITASLRDPKTKSGSTFVFSGTWIEEGQDYGSEQAITPTFTSVDEYADPLARYRDDEAVSAAMKFIEEGWTTIAIYEPTITPDLLRDLYYILEIPLDVSVTGSDKNLTVYANADNILLYSAKDTIANLEFDTNHDITNVLDQKQGWNGARTISIDLKAAEPALLSLR